MKNRTPVHIRVNLANNDRVDAINALFAEGITSAVPPTGIEIGQGVRKIRNSRAYQHGMIEQQDAAAQAVSDMVTLEPAEKLLDVCAGDLGKYFFRSRRLSIYAFSSLFAPFKQKEMHVKPGLLRPVRHFNAAIQRLKRVERPLAETVLAVHITAHHIDHSPRRADSRA